MDELNGINSHLKKKKDKNKEKLSKLARKIKTVEEEKIREHDDMIDLIKAKFLSSKPEDLKEPMVSHSKETEKRNIEQDSDNNCNDPFQGIKDHSEEVQNDDEINKENFEQYETIKKLYKTEMGARKSQIVQNKKPTDEYENDPFLNGHSDLDIKSKIELINYLTSQLTSACEEKQGQKGPEEVNGKGVKIEEEQDYLRNALRNNLFNANIQTNYQEIQQYFSNPSMSIPVFNNFATSIYQQSQLQSKIFR